MDSDVQSVSGVFVFCAHGGEYKSKGSKMICSRDKIAAVEKIKKKRVPCFEFDKVSYNARYANIRGVKSPLFQVLCLLASPASIWACRACGTRFLRYACISCVFG